MSLVFAPSKPAIALQPVQDRILFRASIYRIRESPFCEAIFFNFSIFLCMGFPRSS